MSVNSSTIDTGVAEKACRNRRLTHVLFMIDQLCESGGAERCLLNTIRLLPKDRFRCTLITFKIDRSGIFRDLPCPVLVYPLQRTYDFKAFRIAIQIRRFIRRERVAIVHTFFETSDLWGGIIAKLAGRVRLVSSRRDMGILRSPKHRLAYRWLKFLFDRVLCVSNEVRAFCIEQDKLPGERVLTVYNGIRLDRCEDRESLQRVCDAMQAWGKSRVVVSVGHVRHVKGYDVLARAAAKVCRVLPDVKFLVLGDVAEKEHFADLQRLTAELNIASKMIFAGPCEDVFSVLRKCNVFCLPSRSEGFSNALIEAMAAGLPCVATRVGGNAEALEGSGGFLVQSEDHDAMADRILFILQNPAIALKMSSSCRETAETKFSEAAMIERLTSVYGSILNGDTRSRQIAASRR